MANNAQIAATAIPGLSLELSAWVILKSPSKTKTTAAGAGHLNLSASAAIVAFAICGLIFLVSTMTYIIYIVYRQKKYFHPEYEFEYGESQLPDAVHDNKMIRAVKKKVLLELSKEKGDGKKNWNNLGKFLGQKHETEEDEGSDEEKDGSKMNRDKEDHESMEEAQLAAKNKAAAQARQQALLKQQQLKARQQQEAAQRAQRLDEEDDEESEGEAVGQKPLSPVKEKKFEAPSESDEDAVDVQEVHMNVPMDDGDEDEPPVAIDRPQTAKSDAARRLQQASMESEKLKKQLSQIKEQQAMLAAKQKQSQPQEEEDVEYYEEEGEEEQDEIKAGHQGDVPSDKKAAATWNRLAAQQQ